MELVIIILSIILIILVLLQSNKAGGASMAITGGTESLFANRKERGSELFITRMTIVVGTIFFLLCLYMGF